MADMEKWDIGFKDTFSQTLLSALQRALTPKPPVSAPPRSMVIWFLKFSVKEKILHTACKKELCNQNKRVYFDHDYATDVQNKRKEHIPVKKVLKENGIRFQTLLTRMRVFFETGMEGPVPAADPKETTVVLQDGASSCCRG